MKILYEEMELFLKVDSHKQDQCLARIQMGILCIKLRQLGKHFKFFAWCDYPLSNIYETT